MLLVVLNYVSCEAMDLSSLREDDTNNEDEEPISCDDWEPDYDPAGDSTLCENLKMFCDEETKDMVKELEEAGKNPQGESKDVICFNEHLLEFLNSIPCDDDIECDEDEEDISINEGEFDDDAGDDENLISGEE